MLFCKVSFVYVCLYVFYAVIYFRVWLCGCGYVGVAVRMSEFFLDPPLGYGLCDDLHQRDAVLGFADYHVDVDELYHWFGRVRVGLGLGFSKGIAPNFSEVIRGSGIIIYTPLQKVWKRINQWVQSRNGFGAKRISKPCLYVSYLSRYAELFAVRLRIVSRSICSIFI